MDKVKSVLKNEFRGEGKGVGTFVMGEANAAAVLGDKGILYENDPEKHGMLRRLVGSAMTPPSIGAAIPSIQEAARVQIDNILQTSAAGLDTAIEMEKVFSDFTLDIAWKQILGLDLDEEEVPTFHRAVEDWTAGVMDPLLLLPFRLPGLMRFTKVGRARTYLVSKVEEQLEKLDKDGPDDSTLSKLYYATDEGEDGTTKRLTRTQVIDNALLLIFAGTEISSSTLSCAALILALHPNVLQKIKDEQREIMTQQSIEECVYLDSVIKEVLRIKPLELSELRKVDKTIIVDGKLIPKDWSVAINVKDTHWNDAKVKKMIDTWIFDMVSSPSDGLTNPLNLLLGCPLVVVAEDVLGKDLHMQR